MDAPHATFGSIPPETMAAFAADPVGYLTGLLERLPAPREEAVVVTPSIDALRAVVPATDSPGRVRHPFDGLRVVVDPRADRPRLLPASAVRRAGPSPFGELYPLFQARQAVRAGTPADQADTPAIVAAGDA